jgi:predicted DNA-binding protein
MKISYDIFILHYISIISMTTISVPLSADDLKFLEDKVAETGRTKADIMREALKLYAEDMAVARILRAAAEPSLDGDLDALASKI